MFVMFTTRLGLHRFRSTVGNAPRRPFWRGVVYTGLSAIIMIGGVILTVLGFTDVAGAGVAMMGMLMIAVAILMFFAALRIFFLVAKIRKSQTNLQISHEPRGTVTAMVIEREHEGRTLTLVMNTLSTDPECQRRLSANDKPPDYAEATSEVYPETPVDVYLEPDLDPPPPYGPPTYEQAMCNSNSGNSLKETEHGDRDMSESLEVQTEEPESDQDESLSTGYQDMPHVTL